ncbi:hypothetical protein [Companilactobacillus mishanensis]|uniref:Surface layer protein A domain-containing protein n=1 Tax=Companilactobacillus mishanensis TaxID=2486008 RepID=A0ABW9P7V3_9LACO|nr:hypothetical protein [Companilactobacillus mishanensis]MQS45189.1 hypothetical protein [Companilactobacillus mishanensis]
MKKILSAIIFTLSLVIVAMTFNNTTVNAKVKDYDGMIKMSDNTPVYSRSDDGTFTETGRTLAKGMTYQVYSEDPVNNFFRVSPNEWVTEDYKYTHVVPSYNVEDGSRYTAKESSGVVDMTNADYFVTDEFELKDGKMVYTGENMGPGKWQFFDRIYAKKIGWGMTERFVQVSTNRWIRLQYFTNIDKMNIWVATNPAEDKRYNYKVVLTKGPTKLYDDSHNVVATRSLAANTGWLTRLENPDQIQDANGDTDFVGYYQVSTHEFVKDSDVLIQYMKDNS